MKNRRCTALAVALLALAVPAVQSRAQAVYTPCTFSDFARLPNAYGTNDGIGSAARFNGPYGVAVDIGGNAYVVDFGNNTIRKVTAAGMVTTLVGQARVSGSVDGTGSAELKRCTGARGRASRGAAWIRWAHRVEGG